MSTDPSVEALDRAADAPVLKLDGLDAPVAIESIQLLRKDREYYVLARSTDGAEGLAFTNGRAPYLHPILNLLVTPYFIGKDARDLEAHLWGVYRHSSNYKLLGQALWCPVAWVEFALLDMLGRIAGKSIAELMGGAVREWVPFYVASGRRDSTPEEEVDYLQSLVDETGAKAVKFRIGGRMSRNKDASPGRTETLIRRSREVLGDGIDIHADSNSSYDPPLAIEVGRMLEQIGAVYFEEPCPFDHLENTKAVADALDIPVSGGEQESSQRRFRWMIANRGVDIVQPDLHYYGGLIRSTRVARMAEVLGMPTTVHISGGLGFMYMLHFASYTPDIGRYQEYKRGIERYCDWFDPALEIRDGSLSVPNGPGTGVRDIRAIVEGAKRVE
ncbi:MAG: mandelate racemase/muconate lactonizing enzyme family protein [Candidatus Latescibacteria bacterium]|nr:mandelate racemase/muconate lactonizing enzyme family protein [Candidatus Latescibacterota bacterium]